MPGKQEIAHEAATRTSFDEQYNAFLESFKALCEKSNVTAGIVIFDDPNHDAVIVDAYGHFYDQAKVVSSIYKQYRQKISADIG